MIDLNTARVFTVGKGVNWCLKNSAFSTKRLYFKLVITCDNKYNGYH